VDVVSFDGVSFDGVSRPRRPRLVAALIGAVAIVVAACSSGGAATSAPSAAVSAGGTVYEVKAVTDAKLGTYLVGEDGKTLYVFLKDAKDTSNCSGTCATNWPPFTLDAGETAKAGDGVTGTLGTITRADGKTQVTYDGFPLYYFTKDTKAGDTTGQGLNSVWYVASVAGGPGGASATSAPTAAATKGAGSSAASIIDFGFQPNAITVDIGATVTWTNTGAKPHTVTADDGSFDSGTLSNGGTFSFTFAKAGTYTFHCKIHPSMTGTVTVQASAY
jgi:predicted lipoprotein with Yx(FWY)xxD motif